MSDTNDLEHLLTRRMGLPVVLDVNVPPGIVLLVSSTNVKDVKNTMSSPTENETEDSANDVVQKFRLDLDGALIETIQKKCAKCKDITSNEWIKIGVNVNPGFEADPMDLLAKSKRLVLCQNCGNITVTN